MYAVPLVTRLKTNILIWMLCTFVSSTVWADDLISNRAYWEDTSSTASFEQAKSAEFIPYQGVLSRGYTQSSTWVRLEITPPIGEGAIEKLVVRIRPVYLDEITLFDPLDHGTKPRIAGDTTDFKNQQYNSLTHTFVIPADDQPRFVWLKLKATSTSLIHIEVFTQNEMQDREYALLMSHFAVLAVVAMFMLLVLINWVNYRESLYAFFVARQVYFFFYTAALFGFHRLLLHNVLDAKSIDALYSWMVIVATTTVVTFEWKFLSQYSLSKWARLLLASQVVWSLVAIGLMLFGYTFYALKANMLLNTTGITVFLVVAAVFIDDEKSKVNSTATLLPKRFVVGYYLAVNLVLIFSLMPYLGLMNGNEFAVNGLVFYTLCSGLIMTVLMQLRSNKIRKVQNEFQQQLVISQKQIELEKSRREEQTHLFHMLMHEMKNPLAIIDMALQSDLEQEKASEFVSRAVHNMKDILDRCVKADKLTEGDVAIHKEDVVVADQIQKLLSVPSRNKSAVSVDVDADLYVTTDLQFFHVMLGNLLDNAIRYGDHLAPIEISACNELNDDQQMGVKIVVSNRPSAASWPDPARVFQKYYRSAGAEAQSGTGLGLYLVRTLARLVDGDCCYVPDDKNIRFELWLPT